MSQPVQGYRYFPTPYPTPNTGNMAFDTGQVLPLFQVQGRGMIPFRSFNAFAVGQQISTLPTAYYADVTGGGLIAGQIIGQPLSPPAS
jgi:hypothetical protein